MSHRETRDSDPKRRRSRFDREPSPKRSRRDGKPETERQVVNHSLNGDDRSDRDQKHRRRLQDALPLEALPEQDLKPDNGAVSKELESKRNFPREGTRHHSDPTQVPRSRSYFQHDERGSAGQAGRNSGHKAVKERGWWKDAKEVHVGSASQESAGEKIQGSESDKVQGDDHNTWRHDKFLEMESDPKPPVKRRSFREQKLPANSESADKGTAEPERPRSTVHPMVQSEKRDDRGGRTFRHSDQDTRPLAGERDANRAEASRNKFTPRDRHEGLGNFRGRERFGGRRGNGSNMVRVEKWKHDLYDEANRSPTPKNEEDQIAKIEALLAS